MRPWNQTLGHHAYVYEDPSIDAINLCDISHSLANINRFNGHTFRPISVAEHSIGVASMVSPEHRLGALLHDAAEAYLGDMATPLKSLCLGYLELERIAHGLIATKFDVFMDAEEIRQADLDALVTEIAVLKGGECEPWGVPGSFQEEYAYRIAMSGTCDWKFWRDAWLEQVQFEIARRG